MFDIKYMQELLENIVNRIDDEEEIQELLENINDILLSKEMKLVL
jgi:hypothetical protein